MIETTVQIKSKSFSEFLEFLSINFPDWEFKDMGSSKKPDISHYHIYSKDKKIKGVLEITHNTNQNNELTLKIADNRKTEWSLKAMEELQNLLIS